MVTPFTQSNRMIEYRRLRAPVHDREAFFDPPCGVVDEVFEQNIAQQRATTVAFAGRQIRELAAEARRELLADACTYTREYRDAPDYSPDEAGPVLLAGHQPQLFHPGVLFKNFVLSAMGERLNATAVNLVIDNDAAGPPSIRVPTGSREAPRVEAVPLDEPTSKVPYEERRVVDRELFQTFGSHVQKLLQPFVPNPLVTRLWPYAIEALRGSGNLGHAVAQARHRLEADWGLKSLELPLSRVCRTVPFAYFVATVLRDLSRFAEIHNRAVHEYRRVHHLRSHTHPVPDLITDSDWQEAPFWVWSSEEPIRRRLFVRHPAPDKIELTDRASQRHCLSLPVHDDGQAVANQLLQLTERGIKLRPRALMTTLYTRLFLGDLFFHGIGGAKYDQLTDVLMSQFFGVSPPQFYAVTATMLLPVQRASVTKEDVRRIEQHLRELRFHPEQHVDSSLPNVAKLCESKRQWISNDAPRGSLHERHLAIQQVNAALQPYVEGQRTRLEHERQESSEILRRDRVLASREFSFCLFPDDYLPAALQGLLRNCVA
jgi:hypothetical protein